MVGPSVKSGDASEHFGLPPGSVSWKQIEAICNQKGTSIQELKAEMGLAPKPPSGDYMTVPYVAKMLRLSERTVYTLARKGKMPAFKIEGVWQIPRHAFFDWVDNGGEWDYASRGLL